MPAAPETTEKPFLPLEEMQHEAGSAAKPERAQSTTPLLLLASVTAALVVVVVVLSVLLAIHRRSAGKPALSSSPQQQLPATFHVELPLNFQTTDFTCGASSTQSVLQGFGFNVTEMSMAAEMGTNSVDGTLWSQIVNATVARGLRVTTSLHMTLDEIYSFIYSMKGCVVVAYQAYKFSNNPAPSWAADWIDGHYSVIAGWNASGLLLMDPSQDEGYWGYIPTVEFEQRWHDIDGCCTPIQQLGLLIWSPQGVLPSSTSWPKNVRYTW